MGRMTRKIKQAPAQPKPQKALPPPELSLDPLETSQLQAIALRHVLADKTLQQAKTVHDAVKAAIMVDHGTWLARVAARLGVSPETLRDRYEFNFDTGKGSLKAQQAPQPAPAEQQPAS